MATDEEQPSTSPSGAPVFHHGKPSACRPVAGEECIEAISEHIERYLGPVDTVFHETVSDTVHIDVHHVGPTREFPFASLITSGMSDLPMSVPPNQGVPAHVELIITLPGHWRLGREALANEAWFWPLRLLKDLARLPHKHRTWLGEGHTVAHGDPPKPYAPRVRFSSAILLQPISTPAEFWTLTISAAKTIHFLAVVPLYADEMRLKLQAGTGALLDRFHAAGVNDIVDLRRRNVGR